MSEKKDLAGTTIIKNFSITVRVNVNWQSSIVESPEVIKSLGLCQSIRSNQHSPD